MPKRPTGGVVRRENRDGSASWSIRFRHDGKRCSEVLGREPTWNRKRAEAALQDRLAEIQLGLWQPPVEQAPAGEDTFQLLASEWYARRKGEGAPRTREHWLWAIQLHLLPAFGDEPVGEISVRDAQRFTTDKIADRDRRAAAITRWQKADPKTRGLRPGRGLSNRSIESVLAVAAMILDDAADAELIPRNPFRARRTRLKAKEPRRSWLELDQARALLAAAKPEHRGLLGVLMLAGLRISEACELRWRSVDLAGARIHVEDSKTDAGRRIVDAQPLLLDALKAHRAQARDTTPGGYVFTTRSGRRIDQSNARHRILDPTVRRADAALAAAGRRPIGHCTLHDLRRTYCALLFEAGATPGYAMAQMGHTTPTLALSIYNRVLERKRDTGERMSELLRGPDTDAGIDLDDADHPVGVAAGAARGVAIRGLLSV